MQNLNLYSVFYILSLGYGLSSYRLSAILCHTLIFGIFVEDFCRLAFMVVKGLLPCKKNGAGFNYNLNSFITVRTWIYIIFMTAAHNSRFIDFFVICSITVNANLLYRQF